MPKRVASYLDTIDSSDHDEETQNSQQSGKRVKAHAPPNPTTTTTTPDDDDVPFWMEADDGSSSAPASPDSIAPEVADHLTPVQDLQQQSSIEASQTPPPPQERFSQLAQEDDTLQLSPAPSVTPTPPPLKSEPAAPPPPAPPFISMRCNDLNRYKEKRKISEGGYGVVSKAQDTVTGRVVALKRIKFGAGQGKVEDGVHISALREITTLLSLSHTNIVKIHQAVCGQGHEDLVLVMEYVEHDVRRLLAKHQFSIPEVKCLMQQLLAAVGYLHDRWIIHRDLKTNNLLYGNNGVLKLCDFGMARLSGEPLRSYTPLQWVLTLPFRPPEGLLGAKKYDESIDMWGVGCVFAEMLERAPLFNPKTQCPEVEMLDQIFHLMGTPTQKEWPDLEALMGKRPDPFLCRSGVERQGLNIEGYTLKRSPGAKGNFVSRFGTLLPSQDGRDLLTSLLALNPSQRISASEAFGHSYFEEEPMRCSACDMPDFAAKSKS